MKYFDFFFVLNNHENVTRGPVLHYLMNINSLLYLNNDELVKDVITDVVDSTILGNFILKMVKTQNYKPKKNTISVIYTPDSTSSTV